MKALVTGGAGFVGLNLVGLLLEKGHEVAVIDIATASLGRFSGHQKLKVVAADILNKEALAQIIRENYIGYVFHTAAKIPKGVDNDIDQCLEINVRGTQTVLETALENEVKGVILSSTCDLYGQQEKYPVTEEATPKPPNFYGLSKYCAEMYAREYFQKYGVKTIILRYAGVYGPGKAAGVINSFVEKALKSEPPVIDSDGRKTKDLVHVYDAAAANLLAAEKVEKIGFDIFNISNNEERSLKDLAGLVIKLVGSNVAPVLGEDSSSERLAFDNKKARNILGFQPMSLEAGIKQFIKWKKEGKNGKDTKHETVLS